MAKTNYTKTQLAVCELCDEIRHTLAVHPRRVGWVVRPHHTDKKVIIGHKDSDGDLDLTSEVTTLIRSLEHLGLVSKFNYTIQPL
jgi:hypothetical protein